MHTVTAARRLRGRRVAAHDRGALIVFVGLLMATLLTIAATAIDIGFAKQKRRVAQNTADAAALAAALDLDGTPTPLAAAVTTAKTWAAKNDARVTSSSWVGCVDPRALPITPDATGNANHCISFSNDYLTVRVRLPTLTAPVFLGRVAGATGYAVEGSATATRTLPAPAAVGACGLCVVNDRTLQMSGTVNVTVTTGGVQADRLTMNADTSSSVSPLPMGWFSANGSNWGMNAVNPTFAARYTKLASAVANPFATTITSINYTGIGEDTTSNISYAGNSCTGGAQPFVANLRYRQSVNINSGARVCLPAGTYYFSGTLNVAANATISGTDVTLVFACPSSGCAPEGGRFNFASGSTISITAPTAGAYRGFAILFDPNNASGTPNQLTGDITLTGALYAKQAGFNTGLSTSRVRAWTIVSGGNFDLNGGTVTIDNQAYYDLVSPSAGTTGSATLTG